MSELDRLAALAAARFGLRIDDGMRAALAGLLERRPRAARLAPAAWLARLEGGDAEESRQVAQALSVGETCFFRHRDHFRALIEEALPAMRATAGARTLRLLSAGCASGEEAYSLAIELKRAGAEPFEIVACDMNPESLARARAARYGRWSLRETTPAEEAVWFVREGGESRLREPLPGLVRFEERNLALDDPGFWREGAFDAIFCRNLIIYLRDDTAAALVARFARALVPGGFLFLAPAENLRGLSRDFHLVASKECFYYRSRSADEATVPAVAGAPWHEAIERSARAVAAMRPPGPAAPAAARPTLAAEELLDLVRRDRLAEAAARVDAFDAAAIPELLPMRAAVRLAQGRLAEAEADCDAILARDELDAGARFVRALCCAQRGQTEAALSWARAAAYLDSAFAMPHLHAGVLARRLGEADLARRELGLALELLPREDAARVALYGGGFSRDHLIEMCRDELAAIGGAA